MKYSQILTLSFLIALLVSACGAPATAPVVAPLDIQNTAVAAAFTIVAETQAAVPTNTTIPPTETPTQTPPPTNTPILIATESPVVLPSLEATVAATQIQAAGGDPCNAPLGASPDGRPTKIKLENQSGAPITASLYLNLTAFGVCGYRGYNLAKGGATTITDLPQGCYNVGVFVNDPDKPTKSFGYGCVNNPDQWTFVVTRESVTLQGR